MRKLESWNKAKKYVVLKNDLPLLGIKAQLNSTHARLGQAVNYLSMCISL